MNSPDQIADALRRHLTARSSKTDAEHRAERRALWARLTTALPAEWAQVEKAGGTTTLDDAFDRLNRRILFSDLFERRQPEMRRFREQSQENVSAVETLGMEAFAIFGSIAATNDPRVLGRGADLVEAAIGLVRAAEAFAMAARELVDELPDQGGGKGALSRQLQGGRNAPFIAFAEAARGAWRSAGLTIGGNGVVDQGYSAFLDAVHAEVFGRDIPGRREVLSSLRKG